MKIIQKVKKLAPLRIVPDEEEVEVRVVAPRKLTIRPDDAADEEVLQEMEEETAGFRMEFLPERMGQRRPGKVIELTGLDPDRVYGIEFIKNGTYNVRQIRPATGLEIKAKWSQLLDYNIVQYFRSSNIRRGFRILALPNQVCVGICDWRGPKYVPAVTAQVHKPRIRIGKKFSTKPVLKRKVKFRRKLR